MEELIEVKGSFDSARFVYELKRKSVLYWLISAALLAGLFVLVGKFYRSEFELFSVLNLSVGCLALALIFYLRVLPNLRIGKWTGATYLSDVQLHRTEGWTHWERMRSGVICSVNRPVAKFESANATFYELDGITFLVLNANSQISHNGQQIGEKELEQRIGVQSA